VTGVKEVTKVVRVEVEVEVEVLVVLIVIVVDGATGARTKDFCRALQGSLTEERSHRV
jgi:hypothetical protein